MTNGNLKSVMDRGSVHYKQTKSIKGLKSKYNKDKKSMKGVKACGQLNSYINEAAFLKNCY